MRVELLQNNFQQKGIRRKLTAAGVLITEAVCFKRGAGARGAV
jgi:hypothetical protein